MSFPINPQVGATEEFTVDIAKIRYASGKETRAQRTPLQRSIVLIFPNVIRAHKDAIQTILLGSQGLNYFTWAYPWRCALTMDF